MSTNKGDMVIRLNPERAPVTVKNFLSYVDKGYYNNLIFHRVINGFMIQGGGFSASLEKKSTSAAIKNESTNGLSNRRGTISMARTSNPDSATAQFFINLKNNDFLNASVGRPGYAVFGELVEGMKVLDTIGAVKTGRKGSYSDVPVQPVIILKAERVLKEKKKAATTKKVS
nr:peptidylprolyl isomerase [Endozoicomonas sp. OPT23]